MLYLNTSDNSPTQSLESVSTYEESVQPSHTERSQETDKVQNDKRCTYITRIWLYTISWIH